MKSTKKPIILISIIISLYLFRGNQNFYKKSVLLKKLALAWLAQNVILAFSVGIRNVHYIEHYALAHKRIGVFFFLLATIIGLALVITSSSVISYFEILHWIKFKTLSWLIIAPLGNPVEPEVYIIYAGSFPVILFVIAKFSSA